MTGSNSSITQAPTVSQPKWQRLILLVILGYEAISAVSGGLLLITAPDGYYLKLPVELLHGIFSNFFIPGIILLGLGILNSLAFYAVLRKLTIDWLMAVLALGGLVAWFLVQIIILQELYWLHIIWGIPVLLGFIITIPLIIMRQNSVMTSKLLLCCGVIASLWYVIINIYVPSQYPGYSHITYTVSELSAIGSPTRLLWVILVWPYPLLFASFGWGVLATANSNHKLRIVGFLIIVYSIFNLYWPPMHMRGSTTSLTDTLHITWAVITNIFMWLFMGFGAAALGKRFRIFTVLSIVMHIIFGVLTGLEAPNIPINGPTPTIGATERINIFIFMLWAAVFALTLLNRQKISRADNNLSNA